jgi:hypothetical protein
MTGIAESFAVHAERTPQACALRWHETKIQLRDRATRSFPKNTAMRIVVGITGATGTVIGVRIWTTC